jgi:cell division protein FtsN
MSDRRLGARDYKGARRAGPAGTRVRDFVSGLALGLAVAAVVYISDHRARVMAPEALHAAPSTIPHTGQRVKPAGARAESADASGAATQSSSATESSADTSRSTSSTNAADASAAAKPATGAAPGISKFDFYQMLPRFEVVVPEREHGSRPPPSTQISRPGTYFLQIGSYRDAAVAERVRTQVARLGIAATVQRVAVDNDVWRRVRVGPIHDLALLNRLRRQLQANNMDSLVIRVED